MFRKLIVPIFLIIFFAGSFLFSQTETGQNSSNEIASFEKRLKSIDNSMNYLKNNSIDYNDIITLYTESESLFRELKYTDENKDYNLAVRFLSDKLTVLEEKSLERVSLAKRMDLMYMLMVSMGLVIIVVMSGYSIYMYSRRK